jgi:hypothetical protein
MFLFMVVSLIGASTCSVAAQQTDKGQEEYLRSCAVCHGQDGSGVGEMTSKLQIKPADLRNLAKRSGGVFLPESVYKKIDGRTAAPLHPRSAMPIWGCRHVVPLGIRSEGARGERWSLLRRRQHSKASKKGRKKNRSEVTQAESFLDMPCDPEDVIHDRIQSVVDYLRTIQVK